MLYTYIAKNICSLSKSCFSTLTNEIISIQISEEDPEVLEQYTYTEALDQGYFHDVAIKADTGKIVSVYIARDFYKQLLQISMCKISGL